MSHILRRNINRVIESHRDNNQGKINKNFLMPLVLSMIIQFCEIDQSKYHILASYGIRAIKQVGDLDINMDSHEWKKLERSGMGKAGIYNGQMRYFIEIPEISDDAEMEIFSKKPSEGFPNSDFSHSKLEDKFMIDQFGHNYYHVDTLIKWKEIVHREKDLKALELMHSEINRLSRSKDGKKLLRTMGLNTANQIKNTLNDLEDLIEDW